MDTTFGRTSRSLAAAAVLGLGLSACAGMSNQEKGAVIGAGAGGAAGAVIGNQTGSTARGAIIGAVLGGAAGAIIGNQMDDKAEELDDELEGATVERVGEGILVTFDSGILFDFDSRQNLDELARALGERRDDYEVLVAGHTDAVGSDTYNLGLSERRARAAADYLAAQGIPPSHLNPVGLGESEPVATNETAEGRQENRRVEIAIYASEEYRQELRETHGGGG